MTAKPRFQIFLRIPIYDDRDAVSRITYRAEPMIYVSDALALRLCGRMNDRDFEQGGDGDYEVRDIASGRRVFGGGWSAPSEPIECPW